MDIQRFRAALQELQSIDFDQYAAQHHSPEELMAQQSDGISLAQAITLVRESISKMSLLDDAYLTLLPTSIQTDGLLNPLHQLKDSHPIVSFKVSFKPAILDIIRFERAITSWAPDPRSATAQTLDTLRQQMISEIAEISRQKDLALSSQNSIQSNLQEVAAHKASIETILDNLKILSQKAHDKIEAIDEKVFDFDKQYQLIVEDEGTSKRILAEASARKNEVDDMVRLLRDVALGHAFSKRANDLQSSVRWWGIGYAAGAILLAFYIFSILYWTPATTHNDWVNIIAHITKISPAVLALIFISRQYTKERSIQEEYAFKAAIALTLTPYADELAKTEDADRRKIFMETLSKIYQPPMVEKGDMIPPVAEKLAREVANKFAERIAAQKP